MEYTARSEFRYPTPVELAGRRARVEQTRLWPALSIQEDPTRAEAAYSRLCSYWGTMGGLTTLRRYGKGYYRLLALRRNGKLSAEELEQRIAELKYGYMDTLNRTGAPV